LEPAKALGITIPESVLLRAERGDPVIPRFLPFTLALSLAGGMAVVTCPTSSDH
jgi:hypothetical protein